LIGQYTDGPGAGLFLRREEKALGGITQAELGVARMDILLLDNVNNKDLRFIGLPSVL
jgi:hypothetical protein